MRRAVSAPAAGHEAECFAPDEAPEPGNVVRIAERNMMVHDHGAS